MDTIFLIGAGRSSTALIHHLLNECKENGWHLKVGDLNTEGIPKEVKNSELASTTEFNIENKSASAEEISKADLVISMLPASFHHKVAEITVEQGKSLLTASYVSPEVGALNEKATEKNVSILMEMGLDPGIDHMSALNEIHDIWDKGGKLLAFRSYTGGLVAPESDDNPWHYKITWNPRNVVLAGKGTASFKADGQVKLVPYQRLFERTELLDIPGLGKYEGYPNRDSLKYIDLYGLQDVPTFIRGTLRKPPFSKAWNLLVNTGLTEDTTPLPRMVKTYKDLTTSFLPSGEEPEAALCDYLHILPDSEEFQMIKWLGLLDDKILPAKVQTAADAMEELIKEKWKLKPEDKDMIVMQHEFRYLLGDSVKTRKSTLVVKGDKFTGMAQTVGLPVAIAARMLMKGIINKKGVQIPITPEIYKPVLSELEKVGVRFEINESEG